jgi:hypothetical protein
MGCPRDGCGGTLARWGYGRRRRIRSLGADPIDVRPRRVRCGGCGATQVLLPAALQPRRSDATEVIGTALARKAAGMGYRRIAAALGRSPSTRPPLAAPRPRQRSSHPALAARRARTHPARRRHVQPAGQHRQPAARRPHRSRRRGLVGAPAAGHRRTPVDPHRTPHRREASRPGKLSPLHGPVHRRARGLARPPPPVTMNTNTRRHAVTTNTIASACTPTTGCSSSPKVTLSWSF